MFLFHHLFFKSQHLLWLLSDTFMYRCKHAASTLFNSVKELGIVEVYLKMMVLHRNVSQMWQCDEIGLDINSKSLKECACLYFSILGWGSQVGFHLSAVCYEKNTWKAKMLGDNTRNDFRLYQTTHLYWNHLWTYDVSDLLLLHVLGHWNKNMCRLNFLDPIAQHCLCVALS